MVTVLVFGANGWIGSQMCRLLSEKGWRVVPASARMENHDAVRENLDSTNPTMVVVAAGLTGRPNIDALEHKKAETSIVNVAGAVFLAAQCSLRGIHITTFATGCIYEYDATHPIGGPGFTENDVPNFTGSYYSRTKIAAEMATRELPGHLILRVRMPISCDASPRCFVTKIARYTRVVDVPNSVTVLQDLLPAAVLMMEARLEGVFNFVNPGVVSHTQILEAYKAIVDPDFTYEVMDMETHDTVVLARRSNNHLNCDKLRAAVPSLHIPSAMQSIQRLLAENKPRLRLQAPLQARHTHHTPRHVVVTGGAGFVGSGLVHYLHALPSVESIIVVDVLGPSASQSHIKGLRKVHTVVGDICTMDFHAVLQTYGIDTVFHLAAQTHVDNSFCNSVSFTQTNVLGTHAVLEAVRTYGKLAMFLHVSTDEVYGETCLDEDVAMKETRVLLPTNPYAASKAGAEALVHAYIKSYGTTAVVVRCNNIYGPRQFPEKVVPRFCVRALTHVPLQLQGSGSQTRHFIHVDDAASAIYIAASKGVRGDVFNIGSPDEKCIVDLAHTIISLTASKSVVVTVKDRPFNDVRYWVDDTLLHGLGWTPHVSLESGLASTVQWYRERLGALGVIWPTFASAVEALETNAEAVQAGHSCTLY